MPIHPRDHTKLICDIGELTQIFSDVDSLEAFLQRIADMVAEHMNSEVCSIYLYNEDTNELVLKATKGLKPSAVNNVKLKLGEGLTGLALKEFRPIYEKDASKSSNFRYFPEIGEDPYKSFLVVPIVRGQIRIGAMVIQSSKQNYFTEEDIKVFRAITSQLANTIETARLLITFSEKQAVRKPFEAEKELKFIKGRVGSEGFALAPAVVFSDHAAASRRIYTSSNKQYTLDDFSQAVKATEEHLQGLQTKIEEKLSDVASLIFTAQILMLNDKTFVDSIAGRIQSGINPPEAITQVVHNYVQMFDGLPTAYLREKKHDVQDIGNRLLNTLLGVTDQHDQYENRIVIAQELYPSDILKLSSQNIKGIILLSGGITSHLSILARSLEIPAIITDQEEGLLRLPAETEVLMDAEQGNIYIRPMKDIIDKFLRREEEKAKISRYKDAVKPQTHTKDGTRVKLLANINLLNDLKIAHEYKAEGVGLYRTEFPFMVRSDFPSEEEQYQVYKKLVDGMPDKEITFRTLDIGGDKVLSYYNYGREENPFLGMRSIRFSLKHKDIFIQQLRAILRAGAKADLKIMFPMISSVDEFLEAREITLQCIKDLKKEDQECHPKPAIGMMVELPAVLEIIEELAQQADFFSIGTNDFIQYMLAVDRTNEKVADFYMPHHPSILRALKRVVEAAEKFKKPVSICGDMAHNERYISYFLGIGIRIFSIDSSHIPKIQKTIEKVDLEQAKKENRKILSKDRTSETDVIFQGSEKKNTLI